MSKKHTDDLAVNRFAEAMKKKLSKKRKEGRSGWDDPEQCSIDFLIRLLHDHYQKGDVVDIANICMMLNQRGAKADWRLPADKRTARELVATMLCFDPEDERDGVWLSLEDKRRLGKLPAGTKLYAAIREDGK